MKARAFLKFSAFIFLLIIILVALYVLIPIIRTRFEQPTGSSPSFASLNTTLLGIPDFAKGYALTQQGQFDQAKAYYQKAYSAASSDAERAAIDLQVAISIANTSQYLDSIPLFKALAADNSAPAGIKAQAVESLALLNSQYQGDGRITQRIFSDPPYSNLMQKDDLAGAQYRRLDELAASIYPIPIAEYRIATWYAEIIRIIQTSGKASEQQKALVPNYENIIRERVAAGDASLKELSSYGISSDQQDSRGYRAILSGVLFTIDMKDLAGDPEAQFKALLANQQNINFESYIDYSYAAFLANAYGASRSADIQKLLSVFYSTNRYSQLPLVTFFKNMGRNATPQTRVTLYLLASIDPQFKVFLESLGWKFGQATTT